MTIDLIPLLSADRPIGFFVDHDNSHFGWILSRTSVLTPLRNDRVGTVQLCVMNKVN